jgi:hypothetical protein
VVFSFESRLAEHGRHMPRESTIYSSETILFARGRTTRASRILAAAAALCLACALAARAQSITTFAGGSIDDGRPAIAAGLANPYSVTVAPNGTIFVAYTF